MNRYPKPRQIGGTLIREVIGLLKQADFQLPLDSHIHCAVSAGCDSVALAHLLLKYGRRIAHPGRFSLLHINHHWREDSDDDAALVKRMAAEWNVPVRVIDLEPQKKSGESLENAARFSRKKIYAELIQQGALVFTAHHADDLAETLLWRLFSGASQSHGGGILLNEGGEVRPLLRVRKDTLKEFLREEEVSWREDSTNLSPRFQRNRIRQLLIPAIEEQFPQVVQHLVNLGLAAQGFKTSLKINSDKEFNLPSVFFRIEEGRIRRAHWDAMGRLKAQQGEVHLPKGWVLKKDAPDRWIIQKKPIQSPRS